ncbi:MAG: hypothetical protein MUF54_12515, partial [Polyangiaceae bacterium]|nr:hypothetical protein [Polyangiaceae bacterium]
DRPFRAHLTLVRTKTAQGSSDLAAALRDFGSGIKELGTMTVHAIVLMESELFPAGAKHTRRGTFTFRER